MHDLPEPAGKAMQGHPERCVCCSLCRGGCIVVGLHLWVMVWGSQADSCHLGGYPWVIFLLFSLASLISRMITLAE